MKQSTRFKRFAARIPSPLYVLPLSSALLFTSACGMATFEGEEGILQLQVVHPDDAIMSSLGAVLAEGTQVQMRAIIKDTEQPGTISAVSSDNKSVIEVDSFEQSRVTLNTHKAGRSDIQLSVKGPDSDTLQDNIPLEVREVASTVITNPCKDAVMLTNGHVDMRYSMRDENDKRLTGYGFYPITFEPTGPQVDQDYKFVEYIRVQTGTTPGTFTTQSTLKTNNFEFDVVAPTEITTFIDTHHDTNADPTEISLESGTKPVTTFEIKTDEQSVCGESEHIKVNSLNPEVCTGTLKSLGNLYFLSVSPLDTGSCTLEIQLEDTDETVLQATQFTVLITP